MAKERVITEAQERAWYTSWESQGLFSSSLSADKKPCVVMMPPPNITGVLHMGHALNQAVQDSLVRYARMQGKEACWVPGTDHASIATEAKVVKRLKERGESKERVGRKKFLEEIWQWKEEHEAIIFDQLKRLGISCDWKRLAYTMDENRYKAVIKAFVELYQRGLIYQDKRIIHWDPLGKTALSSEEVLYQEVAGNLYYVRYRLTDGSGFVTVATTRPETIFGDTAICVHPDDDRYKELHGKRVYVPFINREIPIIVDDYIDPSFGTGCLKVTPAHDPNDYEIGKRHRLPVVNVLTEEALLNDEAGAYVGCDGEEARKRLAIDLEAAGLLEKRVPHTHQVGFSERTGAIVEPRLSMQWFVKMEELAQPAIEAVRNGTIRFFPGKFVNMYMAWMENIKDWCISRQLWNGHRIPVYYLADGRFVVAENLVKAVEEARRLTGNDALTQDELQQDPDVLDTWFSSWLWPLSVFNGTIDPDNEEFAYYYPTDDIVTAPEIIFFWVARMIMAGYAFAGKPPFKNVYFTGIVRDKKRRKMSKSLGNSPSLVDLIAKYGADGVRAGMLFCAPAGNDLLFDEQLCLQGNKFSHKIQHACLLVKGWTSVEKKVSMAEETAIGWFDARCHEVTASLEKLFAEYRLSEALMAVYRLFWDDFCAHYLEMVKPATGKEIAVEVHQATRDFFGRLMRLLHPFMPFITEEIWHQLAMSPEKKSIMIAPYPVADKVDREVLSAASLAFELITKVRQLKAATGKGSTALTLVVQQPNALWLHRWEGYIKKATKVTLIREASTCLSIEHTFVVGGTSFALEGLADTTTDHAQKLREELAYQEGFLGSVLAKLNNSRFVAHAPEAVLAREKKKQADAMARIEALQKLLKG